MGYLIIALIAYLAVAIQTTLIDAMAIGRFVPQLPAMVAAAVVLVQRGNTSLAIAAAIGLMEDALWPGRLGVAMGWYLLLAWALLGGCERLDLRRPGRRIAVTGVFAGLLVLCSGATRWLLGEPTVGLVEIGLLALGIGIYTTATALPFWILLGWGEHIVERRAAQYGV